jgi:hypothetical protein
VTLSNLVGAKILADPRCRSSRGCIGKTSDGPAITAKANTICAACVQDLQRQLGELPHLATALRAFLGVTPKTALQSKVNSTPEPACPIDTRVDELVTDLEDVIDRTDGLRVNDLIHQPAMKFILWHRDTRSERYLEGWERAVDIRRVHARANSILGFDRIWVRRHAPCPACGLPTLGTVVGSSTIDCSDDECDLVLSLDQYDQLCSELAART